MARLYVGNLNPSITKEKLADAFLKFGPLLEVWYNPESCYAFMEYESANDAQDAIRHLNNRRLFGVELRVEVTKYKKKDRNFDGPPQYSSPLERSCGSGSRTPLYHRPTEYGVRERPYERRRMSPLRSYQPHRHSTQPRSPYYNRPPEFSEQVNYRSPEFSERANYRSPEFSERANYRSPEFSERATYRSPIPNDVDLSKPLDIGRTRPVEPDFSKPLTIRAPVQKYCSSVVTQSPPRTRYTDYREDPRRYRTSPVRPPTRYTDYRDTRRYNDRCRRD